MNQSSETLDTAALEMKFDEQQSTDSDQMMNCYWQVYAVVERCKEHYVS